MALTGQVNVQSPQGDDVERNELLAELNHENVFNFHLTRVEFKSLPALEDIYNGVEPAAGQVAISKAEILLQASKGLKRLHDSGIVHANLTPANVRLSGSTVLIGGFELSEKKDGDGTFALKRLGHECFLAPEVMAMIHESESRAAPGTPSFRVTEKIDVFAAGCTFFYVLTNGHHPFGISPLTIPHNIMNGNLVNGQKLDTESLFKGMIQYMLRKNPEERVSFWDGVLEWLELVLQHEKGGQSLNWQDWYFGEPRGRLQLTCDTAKRLGITNRRIGGQVFAGTWLWHDVAVKRIFKNELQNGKSYVPETTLKQLEHANLLKLLHTKIDDDFVYLGLELCAASLRDYLKGDYRTEVPSKEDAFKQMTSGLEYIHSKGLIHGAIRPTNVLISRTTPVHLKLSDFGFRPPDGVTKSNSSGDGRFSKEFYFAPELLRNFDASSRGQAAFDADALCDVFSLGCVFYTYITRGEHPFLGTEKSIFFITPNIIAGKISMHDLDESDPYKQLIGAMLVKEREGRASLAEVAMRLRQQTEKRET